MTEQEKILVIRLGALGDMVLCCSAFQAIRAAHPTAHIALLTMPAFADFARSMPWFDEVLLDNRAPLADVAGWWKLLSGLLRFNPSRVYDLQGKFRQTILYTLMGTSLMREWSGAAPLCSHPRLWPPQPDMHFYDFIAAQLNRAGVVVQGLPDMSWCMALLTFPVPEKYVVLIPSCAKGREYKRWPADKYAEIANRIHAMGIACLAVGGKGDADVISSLRSSAPHVTDLSGATSLLQLGTLARHALAAIGNDTGPGHILAACGAPTLTLFSGQVNPVWSSPRGRLVRTLQENDLNHLTVDRVWGEVKSLLSL